jgi:outer membrane protein OmpA-like peptidoglycan-associated protein
MKTNLSTLTLLSLLFIPAFNFAQLASNVDFEFDSDVTSEVLKSASVNNAVNYSEVFNTSAFIKPYMKPTKLAGGVNSQYPELGALVSPDGKTLYFSRYQDPNNTAGVNDEEDIWYAEWNETTNTWGEAKNIGAPLNNKYPNYINSISPDGNTLLLGNTYLANGKMANGLSLSHKTAEGWSFPQEIKIDGTHKNTNWAGSHLSSNQKVLLLAYEQNKNTFGARDLYVSFIKADNTWSKPINLGATINTKGTESSPFLAADDSTLYFTTDGIPGYGGNDIYVTRRLDDSWQKWTTPKNLGPIVNTESHQSFFSVNNGNIYFSSEAGTEGDLDLFMLTLPEPAENTNNVKQPTTIFAGIDENAGTNNNITAIEAILNSEMSSSIVFFDFDKADLKKSSLYELNRLATILKEHPEMIIEIVGHTDSYGSSRYNNYLSQKRTSAICSYFKNQSFINETRLVVRNLGETMPVAGNETKDGRKLNRRVELKLKIKSLLD